jgi:hypothetical protein
MGIEMLLNALMKMCGFTKEQFQQKIDDASGILEFTRETAISLDARVSTIENNQALIIQMLARIEMKFAALENREISPI